jgi:glycosyltransferase involved in cell wall biosynthesis
MNLFAELKVALVHHWLVTRRGGEQVFEAMADQFPAADIYTLVSDSENLSPALRNRLIRSSLLQKLPDASRLYPYYLPLFPAAVSRLDLTGYQLIISSDAAVVKGVRADPGAVHICYCHTPMRCVWSGYETYYDAAGPATRLALGATRNWLRRWDYDAAQRVTLFIANSRNVQKRIRDCYGRDSVVIYPPVDVERFVLGGSDIRSDDFFLVVSQLVPYKRVDLLVEAFNLSGKKLLVIGEGPERRKLARSARPNIQFLGAQPRETVMRAMQQCTAFVFAGEEDFGIVIAEAQACGKPVIAFAEGGAQEIVQPGITGVLFEEQSADSILHAVESFDPRCFDAPTIRSSALRFGRERFQREFSSLWQLIIQSPASLECHEKAAGCLDPSEVAAGC